MTRLQMSLRIAMRALRATPLRSFLTALGVIIGVAAVVTTVAIGNGARASTQAQLSALGTNLLFIFPGRMAGPGGIGQSAPVQTLTVGDAEAIRDAVPGVRGVSPEFRRPATVVAGAVNDVVTVQGVTPAFIEVRNWKPSEGAFFTADDLRRRARVALIGQTVRRTFFPDVDPVGRRIRINRSTFLVVGVMEAKGASGFEDRDDAIFIPLTTAMHRLFGATSVGQIFVQVQEGVDANAVMDGVEALLRRRHRIADGEASDFTIRNQADLLQTFQGVTQTITLMLGAVTAVSLVVGGIGIMNIMLVSVTERTREIGIRKAVGATRRDILLQFLVEATFLSVGGGVIGIALGLTAARAISAAAGWATLVTPAAVLLAFGFAVAVGIFFGLYPAQRAARLDPIVALRTE